MKYNKAVVNGRFTPCMHNGHVSMILDAIQVAEYVHIIVGSANKFPDVRNPVPAEDRVYMVTQVLHEVLKPEDVERVHIHMCDDYANDETWKTQIRTLIDERQTDKIAMVGFDKDEDSYWLYEFGWDHIPVSPTLINYYGIPTPMSSTFLRDSWLRDGNILNTWSTIVPKSCIEFLYNYAYDSYGNIKPEFKRLREEREYWDKEVKKFKDYPYKSSLNCCTADNVVLCNNHVLLIERAFQPGMGAWALPGGHKDNNETFRYAALRELEEEVKIDVKPAVLRGSIRGSEIFDDPKRSAGGICKPTVAQFIVLQPDENGNCPVVLGQFETKKAFWMPLHLVKKNRNMMFDDHYLIIQHFTSI